MKCRLVRSHHKPLPAWQALRNLDFHLHKVLRLMAFDVTLWKFLVTPWKKGNEFPRLTLTPKLSLHTFPLSEYESTAWLAQVFYLQTLSIHTSPLTTQKTSASFAQVFRSRTLPLHTCPLTTQKTSAFFAQAFYSAITTLPLITVDSSASFGQVINRGTL